MPMLIAAINNWINKFIVSLYNVKNKSFTLSNKSFIKVGFQEKHFSN